MKTRDALPAVLAAALTACTVGPNFVRPAAPAGGYAKSAPAPSATRTVTAGADLADDWYHLFQSPALDALVRAALAGNHDLAGARHGLVAAQFELQAVSGAELPQIDAAGQIGRGHINGSFLYGPVNAIKATGNRCELGPSLAYNLDPFGGVAPPDRIAAAADRAGAGPGTQHLRDAGRSGGHHRVRLRRHAAQIEVTQVAGRASCSAQYELDVHAGERGQDHPQRHPAGGDPARERARNTPRPRAAARRYRNALARLRGADTRRVRMPALSLARLHAARPVAGVAAVGAGAAAPGRAGGRGEPAPGQRADRRGRRPRACPRSTFPRNTRSRPPRSTSSSPARRRLVGSDSASQRAAVPRRHARRPRATRRKERYRQSLATYRGTVIGAFVDVANALQALQHDADSYAAHNRALERRARDQRPGRCSSTAPASTPSSRS